MSDASTRIGAFLRDVPPLFTTEKPVSFDPVQTTFLQKLVREQALQAKVSVKKEDFFAAILYLDWFAEVIAASATIFEDVSVIVEELEKIDEFLDPDLELLVRYSGLFAVKELKGPKLFQGSSRTQIAKRQEKTNAKVGWAKALAGPTDLFHQACGRMVAGLVTGEAQRAALSSFDGRNDLRAIVVSDVIRRALPDAPAGADVVELTAALVRASEGWSLRAHVEEVKKKHLGGRS